MMIKMKELKVSKQDNLEKEKVCGSNEQKRKSNNVKYCIETIAFICLHLCSSMSVCVVSLSACFLTLELSVMSVCLFVFVFSGFMVLSAWCVCSCVSYKFDL